MFLRERSTLLRQRLSALKSRPCGSPKAKYQCPEIFLDVVSTKLTSTAVLFLSTELLSEFYYNFPRELDRELGQGLTQEEKERFAKENPRVKGHLECIRRKELLELAVEKMDGIRQLEVQGRGRKEKRRERKGWGRS